MKKNDKIYMVNIYTEIDGNYFDVKHETFFVQQRNIAERFCELKENKSGTYKDGKFIRYGCYVDEFDLKTNAEVMKMIKDLEMAE